MTSTTNQDLAALINHLIALSSCGKGSEGISEFLDILAATIPCDALALLKVDSGKGLVEILGGRGLLTPEDRWTSWLEAPHIAKQAANFPDMPAIAAVGSFVCDPLLSEEKAKSLAMSRVGVGDMYLMTLAIRREGLAFSDEEIQIFSALGGVINLMGRCCHLEQESQSKYDKDNLTGLGRFSAFHEALGKELSRARRGSGAVTIGILSLKRSDDEIQGKAPVPDDQLVAVAALVGDQLRNFDTLTRYSSNEFAFILPDLKVAEGIKVMERVQGEIESAIPPEKGQLLTCIGLAGYPDDASNLERLIEMVEAAANMAGEEGSSAVIRWQE